MTRQNLRCVKNSHCLSPNDEFGIGRSFFSNRKIPSGKMRSDSLYANDTRLLDDILDLVVVGYQSKESSVGPKQNVYYVDCGVLRQCKKNRK